MNNWTFISDLLNHLVQLVQNGGNPLLNAAVGYVRPLVIACAVAWIATQALAVSYANASSATLLTGIFRIAVVVAVLQTAGTYNQWVGDVAQTLPNEIANTISGAQNNITTGQAFNTALNAAFKGALTVWEHAPKYSFTVIIIGISVIGFLAIAIASIGSAALTYAASTIALIFFIKIGPLFLALFAFPQTRRFGSGWVTALVSAALTQIFTVGLLGLLMGAEQQTINQMVTKTATGADPNVIDELISLMLGGFLFWVIWELLRQAASFASSIAGGVHQKVNQFADKAMSVATAAPGVAVKGIAGIPSGGASAARTMASAIQQRRVNRMIGGN
jgi:type IV secretion system protein VirB6